MTNPFVDRVGKLSIQTSPLASVSTATNEMMKLIRLKAANIDCLVREIARRRLNLKKFLKQIVIDDKTEQAKIVCGSFTK